MQKTTFEIFQDSMGLKLTFKKQANCDLAGDSDEDWSSDVYDRNSIRGYYFYLKGPGAVTSCGVKNQATVALCFYEAEYQGLAAAFQEAFI